eukprot:14155795-Alexandrium_andersonii.AAC.1
MRARGSTQGGPYCNMHSDWKQRVLTAKQIREPRESTLCLCCNAIRPLLGLFTCTQHAAHGKNNLGRPFAQSRTIARDQTLCKAQ